MSSVFRLIFCVSVATIVLMSSTDVYALWKESIRIADGERLPEGASATLMLDTGAEIAGEVREDDDGQYLLFILPGSEPRPGTLYIRSSVGEQMYLQVSHAASETVFLDLDAESTSVGMPPSGLQIREVNTRVLVPRRLSFTIGVVGAHWVSDYFDERINRNKVALIPILDNVFGGTNSTASGSADDSGWEYGVEGGVTYNLDQNSGIYVDLGYAGMSAADGSITGSTDVAGNEVAVRASGDSEIDVYTFVAGYTRAFPRRQSWHWYAGLGAMRLEMEDQSVTRTLVNGVEVDRFSASSSEDDIAEFLEAGVRYQLARFGVMQGFGLNLDAGVRTSTETFNGENVTSLRLGIRVGF